MNAIRAWWGISALMTLPGDMLDMAVYDSGKGYKHIKHRSQAKKRRLRR